MTAMVGNRAIAVEDNAALLKSLRRTRGSDATFRTVFIQWHSQKSNFFPTTII